MNISPTSLADQFAPERLMRLDPQSRAVIALATTGVLGGGVDEAHCDPLSADEALAVVRVLTAAGVPPLAVDAEGIPLVAR